MNNERRYYVYEWYIIDTDEVFYVGKGTKRRAWQLKDNEFFMKMYNSHKCDVRIVYDNLDEETAFKEETKLISHYRTNTDYRLTNIADGGNQPPIYKGEEHPMYGKKGELSPNYGKHMTESSKIKLSNSLKEYYSTDEGKKLRSETSKKIMSSKETVAKIVESNKTFWNEPNFKKEWSEKCKKRNNMTNARKASKKSIVQLDMNMNFIGEFESAAECERYTGIGFRQISRVARGERKSTGGFIFMFKKDYESLINSHKENTEESIAI